MGPYGTNCTTLLMVEKRVTGQLVDHLKVIGAMSIKT